MSEDKGNEWAFRKLISQYKFDCAIDYIKGQLICQKSWQEWFRNTEPIGPRGNFSFMWLEFDQTDKKLLEFMRQYGSFRKHTGLALNVLALLEKKSLDEAKLQKLVDRTKKDRQLMSCEEFDFYYGIDAFRIPRGLIEKDDENANL